GRPALPQLRGPLERQPDARQGHRAARRPPPPAPVVHRAEGGRRDRARASGDRRGYHREATAYSGRGHGPPPRELALEARGRLPQVRGRGGPQMRPAFAVPSGAPEAPPRCGPRTTTPLPKPGRA